MKVARPVWGWGPGEIPGLHHEDMLSAFVTAVSTTLQIREAIVGDAEIKSDEQDDKVLEQRDLAQSAHL